MGLDKHDGEWDPVEGVWHKGNPVTHPTYTPGHDYGSAEAGGAAYDTANNWNIHNVGQQLYDRDKMILGRQAPTLRDNSYEFGQVTDSRNLQLEALKQQRAAAMGLGPSVAAQQNKMALGQGMNAMGAGMGGGNLLAQRQAMMGGNAMLGQASQQGAAARGGEIYGAMGAYGQGASGLRSSDLGAQRSANDQINAQRQLQLAQAAHNNSQIQGFEGLDYSNAVGMSGLAAKQADRYNTDKARRQAAADSALGLAIAGGATIATMGAASPMLASATEKAGKTGLW